MKLIHFVYPHKQFGPSLRLGPRLGQLLCCQICLAIPKVNCITLLPTQREERERGDGMLWEIRERPFSYLWGLSIVDMEDYTGTKIALLACVVYALLVLHYYRLVLLSWWTIAGFISTLCTECLYSLFLSSSRCRKIFSIIFLKEPCPNEEV